MKLMLEMDLENGAFEHHRNHEVARILRGLERRLTVEPAVNPGDRFPLLDINGNRVGTAWVESP